MGLEPTLPPFQGGALPLGHVPPIIPPAWFASADAPPTRIAPPYGTRAAPWAGRIPSTRARRRRRAPPGRGCGSAWGGRGPIAGGRCSGSRRLMPPRLPLESEHAAEANMPGTGREGYYIFGVGRTPSSADRIPASSAAISGSPITGISCSSTTRRTSRARIRMASISGPSLTPG